MILLLDTSEKGKTVLGLGKNDQVIVRKVYQSAYHQADTLLEKIHTLLTSQRLGAKDLEGVVVVLGPGPFTALRGALTIANGFAFANNIPVAGFTRAEFTDFDDLLKKGSAQLQRSESAPNQPFRLGARKGFLEPTQLLTPHYGSEPNISQPQKR